ncbi:MAG: hypothetical protein II262_03000, partial [Alistipes sp.]|nr:hypothetical protein [Alistipes sp.]
MQRNAKVDDDEVETVKAVHIYYCPVFIDGTQYSARMVVKEYYQGAQVINELHLYNVMLKKRHQTNTLSQDGTPHMRSDASIHYKVSDLIHNTQELDQINFSKIAVDTKGNRYYDHKLTQIEKEHLLDLSAVSSTESANKVPISDIKDKRLLNIIQTNSKENANKIKLATGWERGADGKWRYKVTEIELLDGSGIPHTQSADFIPTSNNSITLAKLLKGVKKNNSSED